MTHTERGFTLVELAISLVVIGLLVGGILKGQEVVENARLANVVRDLSAIETASVQFFERFNAIPGDFNNPSLLPATCTGTCLTAGNNNKIIDANHETSNFFLHLESMGYIKLKWRDGYILPLNSWNGPYRPVHWDAFVDPKRQRVRRGNYLTLGDTTDTWAVGAAYKMRVMRTASIDRKIDDGKPLTGHMQVDLGSASQASCYNAGTQEYVASTIVVSCNPFLYLDGANPHM